MDSEEDVVHSMSIPQRLDHLLSGYMRLNYNESNDKHFPADITAICISYTGITKHDQYELIKSNTEIKQQIDVLMKHWNDQFCRDNNELKIVVAGGAGVGRAALIIRFVCDNFLEDYDPYIDDNFRKQAQVDGTPYLFNIYYGGEDHWEHFKDEWVKECNLFIFVYSVASWATLKEAQCLIEEVDKMKHGLDWYGVLVGNKCDLYNIERRVGRNEGEKLAQKYPNLKFFEASAREKINNCEIFYECARWYEYVCDKRDQLDVKKPESCCTIL